MTMKGLSQFRLKEVLYYCPATGDFLWKNPPVPSFVKVGMSAGYIQKIGYRAIKIDGILHKAHRLAWFYMYDEVPDQIDHINRVKSDNRIVNLRVATPRQNMGNMAAHKRNKSGLKGVNTTLVSGHTYYRALIYKNRKQVHLGNFKSPIGAARAYDRAAREYFGEFAALNNV